MAVLAGSDEGERVGMRRIRRFGKIRKVRSRDMLELMEVLKDSLEEGSFLRFRDARVRGT
jgi:hypothetical protein